MTIRFAAPLLAAGLLSLAACGSSSTAPSTTQGSGTTAAASTTPGSGSTDGSGTSAATTVPDSAATVDVKAVEGVAWNQKSYTATAKDGKVTINGLNSSSIAHNLYVLDGNDKVMGDFINLPQHGSKGTVVLDLQPGTYRIVCKVPGHQNMNSTLTVN